VRVDLGIISEDLRQRVLTAIASELERDEAERPRNAQEQDGAGDRFGCRVLGTEYAIGVGDAADVNDATPANGGAAGAETISGAGPVNGRGVSPESSDISLATSYGVGPANGSSAIPENGSAADLDNGSRASLDDAAGAGPGCGIGPVPGNASPWDQELLWPGTPAQQGGTQYGDAADVGRGAADDATAAQEPEEGAQPGDAGDPAAADGAAGRPAVPLPRRAPGTNGAPPPPTELRREYLPPSVLGRRLDPEEHTEPLPRISRSQPVFSPVRPAAESPAAPDPAGSPAEPGPSASRPSTAEPAEAPAEPVSPGTPPAEAVPPGAEPPDSVPPRPAPSASTIAAASAPTMPVGSAALAAASAPTMPAGSAELAAAASAFAPPAEPAQAAPRPAPPPDQAPPPAPPMPVPSSAPALSPPGGYGWVSDLGLESPGTGRGGGTAAPLPTELPAAKRPRRSGGPYRIAGVILAVVALVGAAVIALELSGRTTARHGSGLGPPAGDAGAMVRKRAAAWVAGQVSRTAVVACDPVMCQALSAHGVAAGRLYRLGPHTTSPFRSQVIVGTAAVRAQFGNVLSSVYAPAVLASFGFGPDRIDIRATARHGAAAYLAMLSADLANRKASGAELLHSGRIAATALARRELATGEVDGRLLVTIAQMAATHPTFIVDFGTPAPGAEPDMPLRQADLAEDAHAGQLVRARYVRSMVSFLRAQHSPFRPAREQTVHLAGGLAVLRIEFTAPSPLGLLGPRA
jgi:hypothetical protein